MRRTIDMANRQFSQFRSQVIEAQSLYRNEFYYDVFPENQKALKLGDAQRIVDEPTDHVLIRYLKVNAKAVSSQDIEDAEKRSKWGTGYWHMVWQTSQINPGRQAIKNLFATDMGCLKTLPDVDCYEAEPPKQDRGESNEEYQKRIRRWERGQHLQFPFWVTAPNPAWLTWDLGPNKPRWVTETYRKWGYQIREEIEILGGDLPRDLKDESEYEMEEFWEDGQYAIFRKGDSDPLIKKACDFGLPYAIKLGGNGLWDLDGKPERIMRGLLTQHREAIIERSRQYAMGHVIVNQIIIPSLRVNREDMTDLRPGSGETQYVPPDVDLKPLIELEVAPDLWRMMEWQRGELARDTAPSIIAGIRQPGTSSAAESSLQLQEARMRFESVLLAAKGMFEQATSTALRIVDEVFPKGVRVYGRSPYGNDVDQLVTTEDIDGAYAVEIELLAGPPEDLDRLAGASLEQWKSGAISLEKHLRDGLKVQDPLSEMGKRRAEDAVTALQPLIARMLEKLAERYGSARGLLVADRSAAQTGRNGANGAGMSTGDLTGMGASPSEMGRIFQPPGSPEAEALRVNEMENAANGTSEGQRRYLP
jgi:hypothetical protein